MDSQQEKTKPPSDQPSFFGVPPQWRVWSQLGGRFWGGVLCGVGIGFFVAAAVAELELATLRVKPWVAATFILFWATGLLIAFRAVGRSQQVEKDKPQNA